MHDGGVTDQVLPSIRSEIAVFTFELLDIAGIVKMFVSVQVVLVGEFSSTCWTRIGTLLSREVYGEVDIEKSLADGDIGA
jgi:hypothetical protein